MDDEVQYLGTFEKKDSKDNNKEKEKKKVERDKTKFKVNKHNKKISKLIYSTKTTLINKKVVIFAIILILIYIVKPITFLRNKLDEKRQYYAQFYSDSYSSNNIFDSINYLIGIDYYKNCKDTMTYPADGLITCQYDLAHQGIDIACDEYPGNIYAVANGHVCYIGYSEKYGNEILIEHEINNIIIYTYYANLSAIYVTNGEYVYQNQVIALEGGNPEKAAQIMDTDGHHLHFEIRKAKNSGTGLNPLFFLQ